MAQMIPADPPPDTRGKRAERALYLALEEALSDDHFVYHGLPYLARERAEEGEVDFLVVHRERGMLVIECKGGGVVRKASGDWVRDDRRIESPFDQAQGQVKTLVRELEARSGARLPFVHGHAVAFPFAARKDAGLSGLPLDVQREMLLTADDLATLDAWVERAFAFWKKAARGAVTPLSPADFRRFRRHVLHPELQLVETLGSRLEVERAALERLTEDQLQALKGCLENRRLRVVGGAGTGKTALALEAARTFAREPGKNVLLICFNRMLAAHLAAKVGSWGEIGGAIDVTTFHHLCRRAFDALGLVYAPPTDADAAKHFWNAHAPSVLFDALGAEKLPRYDAIVVDEAQDFHADWSAVLDECMRDPKSGHFVVFFDPGQKIFDRPSGLSEAPASHRLTTNFRNAREIAKVVRELGRVEMEPHRRVPDGEPPVVHGHEGPSKVRAQVDALVRKLVAKQNVAPEQITVLTPHRREHSSLRDVTTLGGLPLADAPEAREGRVLHTTIGAFKGLESDVIILLDVDPADERCDRRARYVAASRARLALHVFAKGDWLVA